MSADMSALKPHHCVFSPLIQSRSELHSGQFQSPDCEPMGKMFVCIKFSPGFSLSDFFHPILISTINVDGLLKHHNAYLIN